MLLVNFPSIQDYRMCDSPLNQFTVNLNGSLTRCSHSVGRFWSSENHLASVNEFESDSSTKLEMSNPCGQVGTQTCDKTNSISPYRFQLEQDVRRLQQQLCEEMELHAVLVDAVEHASVTIPGLSCLPHDAQELLSNIATLEFTVSKLEKEMVSLHFQLSQERNERRLAEYHLKNSPTQSLLLFSPESLTEVPLSTCLRVSKHSNPELHHTSEDISCQEAKDTPSETSRSMCSTCLMVENRVDFTTDIQSKKEPRKVFQHVAVRKLNKEMSMKGLWNHPNRLSEEMVLCMKSIFISLADSSTVSASEGLCSPVSPHGHLSNSSLWSLYEPSVSSCVQSPQVDLRHNSDVLAMENSFDPYKVRGKLSWADIGSYGLAIEVSWMSVGKKQLEYAAGALHRFRAMVEQLAKVNPIRLTCDEKLAFWINLYNALIMHAYLAYGVPRSELKLFSLMQKAAYTVGGHSFNAAAIEYVILKMKPPVHRPQTALLLALQKLKVSEKQMKFSVDSSESLVAFALSSGMYSSPGNLRTKSKLLICYNREIVDFHWFPIWTTPESKDKGVVGRDKAAAPNAVANSTKMSQVRIYTPGNLKEELEEAQRDFVRATVGVSEKGKLLVPKVLHCFAKGLGVDDADLDVWITHFLPPHQAAFVEQCMSQRRQSFLGSRNCGILPFDSRFRYLFLPQMV